MRSRTSYVWTLGVFIAFVAMFAFDGPQNFSVGGSAVVSAPAAPLASVAAVPGAPLIQSHFERCGPAVRSANLDLTLWALYAGEGPRATAGAAQPHYGPLHRRPPPNFS